MKGIAEALNLIRTKTKTEQQELDQVRGDIEQLRQRREYLQSAPLTREDRADIWMGYVREQQNNFLRGLENATKGQLSRTDEKPPYLLQISSMCSDRAGGRESRGLFEGAVFWFLGDDETIRARILDAMKHAKMHWPDEFGPPLAERRKELAQIEHELARLETRAAELEQSLQETLQAVSARG